MPRHQDNRRVKYNKDKKTQQGKHVDFYNGKKAVHNLGAGDTFYIPDFVKSRTKQREIFQQLLGEVEFQQMFNFLNNHVEAIPRLIAAQTDKANPKSAIYRMPGCNESNIPTKHWTPTVEQIMKDASEEINQELNHCVLTLYRDENDSLAFHQDKILDLEDNSMILSISFGEPRPILFHEINGKKEQQIMLQPGSLLAFGPKTNSRYKHAIPKMNDPCGPRISLSIRTISSFVEKVEGEEGDVVKITGKGEDHQCVNYPFIKSYDNQSEYTEVIQKQIEEEVERSVERFQEIRAQVCVSTEA
jgi:alkylated DNA repair dioxygenase AlkB